MDEIDVEIVDEALGPESDEPVEGEPAEAVAAPVLFDDGESDDESDDESDVAAAMAELKRLRAQAKVAPQPQAPVPKQLGTKPKLSDFDYDGEKFEAAIDEWHATKAEVDRAAAQQQAHQQAQAADFEAQVKRYQASRADVGADDYDAVEMAVQGALDLTQQGVLIQGSEHGAALVYALGKSKARLAELAKIKDPIRFAFAVARLEGELMSKQGKGKRNGARTAAPAPEKQVRKGSTGTGGGAGGANDRKLEQLRAEAAKTGDVSKVVAFKRKMKERKAG